MRNWLSTLLLLLCLACGGGGGGGINGPSPQPAAGLLSATSAADGRSVALKFTPGPSDLDGWWVEMSQSGGAWTKLSPTYPTDYLTYTYAPAASVPDRTSFSFRAGGERKQVATGYGPSTTWNLGVRGATWLDASLIGADAYLAWGTDSTLAGVQSVVERRLTTPSGSVGGWVALSVPAGAWTLTDSSLPEGSEVQYRVRMQYQAEASPNLAAAALPVPLPPPTALTALGGVESAALTWVVPSASTQSILVYETNGAGASLRATLPAGATSWSDASATPGGHTYQVAAATYRREYLSAKATATAASVAAPVLNPPVCGAGQNALSWTLPKGPGGQGIEVYRTGLTDSADVKLATLPPEATSYLDTTAPGALVNYLLVVRGKFSYAYSQREMGLARLPSQSMGIRRLPLAPVAIGSNALSLCLDPAGLWWLAAREDPSAGVLAVQQPEGAGYRTTGISVGDFQSGGYRPAFEPAFDAEGRLTFLALQSRTAPWSTSVTAKALARLRFDGTQFTQDDLAAWFDPSNLLRTLLGLGRPRLGGVLVELARRDDTGALATPANMTRVDLGSTPLLSTGPGLVSTYGQTFEDGQGRFIRMNVDIPGFSYGEPTGYAAWDATAGWQVLPSPPDLGLYNVYSKLVFVPLPTGFGVFYRSGGVFNNLFPWRYCSFENGTWGAPSDVSALLDSQEGVCVAAVQEDGGRPCLMRADQKRIFLHVREVDGWKTQVLSDGVGPGYVDALNMHLAVGYAPGGKLTACIAVRTDWTPLSPLAAVFEFREP